MRAAVNRETNNHVDRKRRASFFLFFLFFFGLEDIYILHTHTHLPRWFFLYIEHLHSIMTFVEYQRRHYCVFHFQLFVLYNIIK